MFDYANGGGMNGQRRYDEDAPYTVERQAGSGNDQVVLKNRFGTVVRAEQDTDVAYGDLVRDMNARNANAAPPQKDRWSL